MNYSAVVTSCRRPAALDRALASVVSQSLPAKEILVIEDGQDGQDERIKSLVKNQYPQVRLISNYGSGISAARNTAIKTANEDWLAFLDDDDQWMETKVEEQMQAISQSNLRLCHTNELWLRNGKRINQHKRHTKSGGAIYLRCLELCCISPSSVLIEKSIFTDYGLFDEDLPVCEDYDMWLRICAYEEVSYINQPLVVKHGGHEDQLSHRYWGMDRFRVQALMKMLQHSQLRPAYRAATLQSIKKRLNILQQGAARRGKGQEAKSYLAQLEELQD